MASASLPEIPKDTAFEEYVAAVFQTAGLFVERDLTERAGIDVFQLDAIVTDYGGAIPRMRLVEAKSGSWSINDLFKIRGWMHYLRIDDGALVTSHSKERLETYRMTGKRISVEVFCEPDFGLLRKTLTTVLPEAEEDPVALSIWRFSYWLERQLLRRLLGQAKSAVGVRRFGAIRDYAAAIHDGVFASHTVSERVERLYDAFSAFRNVAARAAVEKAGGGFPEEADAIPTEVFRETFYRSEMNEVQVACLVEHRCRLAVLKAAVDYLAYQEAGETSLAAETFTWTVNGQTYTVPFASFTNRFREALDEIKGEPHFRRYPLFWQWFHGAMGAFWLLDYEDKDRELLAAKSGIPLEHLDDAISAYDKLFPIPGGWFRQTGSSRIRFLMLYPCQMRGIGANYRRLQYTKSGEYEELDLTGQHTRSDLFRWNNAAVEALNWGA